MVKLVICWIIFHAEDMKGSSLPERMIIKRGEITAPKNEKAPVFIKIFRFFLISVLFFTSRNQNKTPDKKIKGEIYPAIFITPEESQFSIQNLLL